MFVRAGRLQNEKTKDILLLALLLAPTYLNDFFLMVAASRKEVLVIDFVSKAMPLLMLFFMPSLRSAVRGAMAARPDWRWPIFIVVCMALVPVLIILEGVLTHILPDVQLFDLPSFRGSDWYWFDMTAGMVLNSISEELIYRGVLAAILLKYGRGNVFIVIVSAMLFAGAHWSKGLANVVAAGLYGILYMAVYLNVRSIWPGAIVHTATNIIVFA